MLETAERLRRSVCDKLFDLDGSPRAISASFGVAVADAATSSGPELTARADHALYEAKTRGRNCCVLAAPAV